MIDQLFDYKGFHILAADFFAEIGMVIPLMVTSVCNVILTAIARLSRIPVQLAAAFTAVDQAGKQIEVLAV